MLETVIIIVHLVGALGIVGFVLIQQGKGAETGASFGSGASGTVFGSQGSSNFLSRLTAVLASVFFVTSLGLAYYAIDRAYSIQLCWKFLFIRQLFRMISRRLTMNLRRQVKVMYP